MEDGRRRWGESFIWILRLSRRLSRRLIPGGCHRRIAAASAGGTCICLCGGVQGSPIALVRNDSAQAQPRAIALIRFRGKLEA